MVAIMPRRANFTVGREPDGRWFVNVAASVSETGLRYKDYYPTKKEASSEADRRRIARENFGSKAAQMPQGEIEDAKAAQCILAPFEVSLTEAAKYFRNRQRAINSSISFEDAVTLYIHRRRTSEGSASNYRTLSKQISPHFEGLTLEEIDENLIEKALKGFSSPTFNKKLTLIGSVFRYAIKRKKCTHNPAASVEKVEVQHTRQYLTPEQAEKLMIEAGKHEGGVLAPYFALLLFAGLRPTREGAGLKWADVKFERNIIVLPQEIAKGRPGKRKKRIIELQPNLKAWLQRFPNRSETISPWGYAEYSHRIAREAILDTAQTPRVTDITRHSFCSYWLAKYGDLGRLCMQSGHSAQVAQEHYVEAVEPDDADLYWGILP